MKLLLWACVMCVAFARRRRYPFIHKKSPSSTEEDYFGNRYPLNPSLNIPYGLWNDNLPPFLLPPLNPQQENAITKFPGNSEVERGLPLFSWIPTSSKLSYIFQSPNYPADAQQKSPAILPLPPPQPFPPRPYPFVIPPKISIISPVGPESGAASAVPAEGEGLVPEFPVDKVISVLPPAVKAGTPMPASEPKPLAPEPASAQFGAPEPASAQFGAPEPASAQFGAPEPASAHFGAPEPAPAHFGAPELVPPHELAMPAEPTLPVSVGAQSILVPENKPTSGEPAVVQSLPALPAADQAAEAKLSAADSAASQLPPAELTASQSDVRKLITAEPTEAKPEGPEPNEAKSISQEPPFFCNQIEK